MITFLTAVGLIISLGLNVATIILIQKLLTKINTYETWILEFKQDVEDTLAKMRAIDEAGTFKSSFNASGEGTFESDDQVGVIFKELSGLVEKLNERTQ